MKVLMKCVRIIHMQRAITLNQSLFWKIGTCSPNVRIFAPSANCNGTSGRLCVNVLLLCLIFSFSHSWHSKSKFLVWTRKRLSCRKSAKRCHFSFVEPLRNRLYDNKDWFYQLPCFIKFVLQIRVCPSYITSFLYQWSEFSFIIVLHVFTLWLTQSNSPKLHFMTDSLYTMSRKQNKDKMGLQFVKTKNKNYATDLTSTSEHYLQMYTVRTFCFLL